MCHDTADLHSGGSTLCDILDGMRYGGSSDVLRSALDDYVLGAMVRFEVVRLCSVSSLDCGVSTDRQSMEKSVIEAIGRLEAMIARLSDRKREVIIRRCFTHLLTLVDAYLQAAHYVSTSPL